MQISSGLSRPAAHCVHFASYGQHMEAKVTLRSTDVAAFELDANAVANKRDLLAALATNMRFPAYFGMNWDAVDDCLRSLRSWVAAEGYVLFILNAEILWSRLPHLAGHLVDAWLEHAEFWARQEISFHLVFVWSDGSAR